VDIGGDFGALVVYTGEHLLGEEVEIASVGLSPRYETHTVIRRRRTDTTELMVGVYPDVPAGRYIVWDAAHETAAEVVVEAGRVSELDLPGSHRVERFFEVH